MPTPSFQGPRLKVQRALQHVHEAETELAAFLETDFYDVVVDTESEPGASLVGVRIKQMPSVVIPLAIGDAVHNLRASLDFLASEVLRAEGKEAERIHFPFHEEYDNLSKQKGNSGLLKLVSGEIADLVIDVIKPFRTGNYALWALNKLDNWDKHKLILPVFATTQVYGICGTDAHGNYAQDVAISLKRPGTSLPMGFGPGFKIEGKPGVAASIYFAKDQFFDGEAVFPTLRALAQNVSGVIDAFEALCAAAPPGA